MEYSLEHFQSFTTRYEIQFADGAAEVEARVFFSNHCYSRSMRAEDDERHVIDRQRLRNGAVDLRVFCVERWRFSLGLRGIIEGLLYKPCLAGGSQRILYRQEGTTFPGERAGWYNCMRLDYRVRENPAFQVWVRSVHRRNNRPVDVRGGPKRFCVLVKQFLEKKTGRQKH